MGACHTVGADTWNSDKISVIGVMPDFTKTVSSKCNERAMRLLYRELLQKQVLDILKKFTGKHTIILSVRKDLNLTKSLCGTTIRKTTGLRFVRLKPVTIHRMQR